MSEPQIKVVGVSSIPHRGRPKSKKKKKKRIKIKRPKTNTIYRAAEKSRKLARGILY